MDDGKLEGKSFRPRNHYRNHETCV